MIFGKGKLGLAEELREGFPEGVTAEVSFEG
jgi:hypothetical protein